MQSSNLLEAIWRGDIACAENSDTGVRFGRLLDALMPMPRIGLMRGDRAGADDLYATAVERSLAPVSRAADISPGNATFANHPPKRRRTML